MSTATFVSLLLVVVAAVAVAVLLVEWRIRAGQKRSRSADASAGHPLERDAACDLLSEMVDTLLAATEHQSGLIHRLLTAVDLGDFDTRAAMEYASRTVQDIRRVGDHIHTVCGDDLERAEACRNLRGGSTNLRTIYALKRARSTYPNDNNVAESLRAVERLASVPPV